MTRVGEMELKLFDPSKLHTVSKDDTRKTMKKIQELVENSVADPTKQETFQLNKVAQARVLDADETVVVPKLSGITNDMVTKSMEMDNDKN
jgi:hypothetical protein